MKPNPINYILFLFAKHENQDSFIKNVAEDLSVISDSDNVKFYYGTESGIFTFQSKDDFPSIHEYMEMIFEGSNLAYFLLPFNHDTLSVGLQKEIYKHLFNVNGDENMSGKEISVQKMSIDRFEDLKMLLNEDDFDDEGDDTIKKIKSKPIEPSVDDILDKICDQGISSLSEKELSLLNEKYSK